MLAGVAGLAIKNRDKLQGMMRRKGDDEHTAQANAPATPVVVHEPGPTTGTGPAVDATDPATT